MMYRVFLRVLLIVLCAGVSSGLVCGAAHAKTAKTLSEKLCAADKPPQINVRPVSKNVKYDYSQTLAQLQTYDTDTINPYGFHSATKTQGFSKGGVNIKQEIKMAHRSNEAYGAGCIWYDEINVDIEIDPEIVIAKEVYENKCKHAVVLEHELKHVKVDRQAVNDFARGIGKKLYDELTARGFTSGAVPAESMQSIADRMQKTVAQLVAFETKKMEIARTEAQSGIDSLAEYERVTRISNNCR